MLLSNKRKSYRHGDVRDSAIKEAIKQVEDLGYEKFSFRGVADSLGVNHKALYRYFPTKSDLLSHVAAYGFNQLGDMLEESHEDKTLDGIFESYIDFAFERPRLYSLMFGNNFLGIDVNEHIEQAVRRVTTIATYVFQLQQPKNCNLDNTVTRNTIVTLWATAHGLISLDHSKLLQSSETAEAIGRIKALVRHSIKAHLLLLVTSDGIDK